MSIASPPRSLTTVGVVTHPRRNCDEVFTAIVGWARARGARLIALPKRHRPGSRTPISFRERTSRAPPTW